MISVGGVIDSVENLVTHVIISFGELIALCPMQLGSHTGSGETSHATPNMLYTVLPAHYVENREWVQPFIGNLGCQAISGRLKRAPKHETL